MPTNEKSKLNKITQCSATHCKNDQCDSKDIAFYRFPKDPDRCARWVENLGNASLREISSQRLNLNHRVCSAHFDASQLRRPSDVHAGLKRDAVPTMVNVPVPDQELPPKKRKINIGQKNDVDFSNAGASTADSVEQPTVSETDITSPNASVAGPSMPLTPPLPPVSLPTDLKAAAANEPDLKTKIKSLKWNKRTQCSAIHCKNYQWNNSDVAFHRFPNDPDRCAKWVQNLRNASLMGLSSQKLNQSYRVCSAHFDPSQFKRRCDVHAGLKWNAVPTIVNAPDPPPPLELKLKRKRPKKCQELPSKKRKKSYLVDLPNAGLSTADSVEQPADSETDITSPDASAAGPSMPLTPLLPPMSPPISPPMSLPTDLEAAAAREHALKKKIKNLSVQVCKLKKKIRDLNQLKKTRKASVNKQSVMEELKKLLPAKAYAFVSTQIRVSQRKANGFRWTTQDKAFFLSLLHAGPMCYRLLLKVFSMPSVRTLQKLMKSVDCKPGFNPNILATMETTKPMDKISAKHCSQHSPGITINTERIFDEHSYDRVTTECREDETITVYADPLVTANAGAEAGQAELPVEYSIEITL